MCRREIDDLETPFVYYTMVSMIREYRNDRKPLRVYLSIAKSRPAASTKMPIDPEGHLRQRASLPGLRFVPRPLFGDNLKNRSPRRNFQHIFARDPIYNWIFSGSGL